MGTDFDLAGGTAFHRGVYIVVYHLPAARSIRVGALGRFHFDAGFYLYVGTAQTDLPARLARHARRRKVRRWHIDYLAHHAPMVDGVAIEADRSWECRLAGWLAQVYATPIPGFGASDCRCRSHLFHRPVDGMIGG